MKYTKRIIKTLQGSLTGAERLLFNILVEEQNEAKRRERLAATMPVTVDSILGKTSATEGIANPFFTRKSYLAEHLHENREKRFPGFSKNGSHVCDVKLPQDSKIAGFLGTSPIAISGDGVVSVAEKPRTKPCVQCGQEFEYTHGKRSICSDECRKRRHADHVLAATRRVKSAAKPPRMNFKKEFKPFIAVLADGGTMDEAREAMMLEGGPVPSSHALRGYAGAYRKIIKALAAIEPGEKRKAFLDTHGVE